MLVATPCRVRSNAPIRARRALCAPRFAVALPAAAAQWVVGANIGNVPWEFQHAKGQFVGFEIELVTEVARRNGHTVKTGNSPFNGLCAARLRR